MKVINTNQLVVVPDEVEVTVKSRVVTVKGARGTLTKVRKVSAESFLFVSKISDVFSPVICYFDFIYDFKVLHKGQRAF